MSIDDRLPNEPRTGQGPRGTDWFFGLAVTVLFATDLAYLKGLEGVQTAVRYYNDVPGVLPAHYVGFGIDVAIVLTIVVWLLRPYQRGWFEDVISVLAMGGMLTCWGELFVALRALPGAIYRLNDLPYGPINNWGLIGALVFTWYLVAKSDLTKLFHRKSFFVKVALFALVGGGQFAAFQVVRAKVGA